MSSISLTLALMYFIMNKLCDYTIAISEYDRQMEDFFNSPFVITPRHMLENLTSSSDYETFFSGRRLIPIVSPFITNEPTGYITGKFYFQGDKQCVGYPTMKTNALGICFSDFSNGGSMMFTSNGVSTNNQMLFYQNYYTTVDCSGGALTEVQYLNTACIPARYSDPLGKGSPFLYEYTPTLPSINDHGVVLSGYIKYNDCLAKNHMSYRFWFPLLVCQNGMIFTECGEDSEGLIGNSTIEYYNSRLCQGQVNTTKKKFHKHCVFSNDDDEPENNYYSTRCTGVPHADEQTFREVYIFPFCFASSETVLLESGDHVTIDQVKVGDRVLAADRKGRPLYSTIIAVPHEKNFYPAEFYHLETTTGRSIRMMGKHITMISRRCTSQNLLSAADLVEIGDCLLTIDGPEMVEKIVRERGYGVHTIVTMADMLVVNGVVSSPFAGNHVAANSFYNVHRWIYKWWPGLLEWKWFKKANEIFGSLIVLTAMS